MQAVVDGLRVYPVKSCRGVVVARAPVEARGLRHDRRWMIIDADGIFVTQRTVPRLALVEVSLETQGRPRPLAELPREPEVLVLRFPGAADLRLPIRPSRSARARRVRVWRDHVEAIDCGPEAARWLSAVLKVPAALVYMPDEVTRPVNPTYARPGDQVGFADGFPLLIASTSSLEDLNARLDVPLPMDRFRPNIVVGGTPPWAEDTWRRVLIGALAVRVVKPCTRGIVTTTDQETLVRGVEPLRTLGTFRRVDNDVLFAQNAIPDAEGTIAVGDTIIVLDGPCP